MGRFFVSSQCTGFEFVPASTSARYKCEFARTFSSLEAADGVSNSDYMSIAAWKWLTFGNEHILVVDAETVTLKSKGEHPINPLAFSGESTVKKSSGQIKYVSTFLRLKDNTDPFSGSFCIHLTDGEVFVLRGPKFFALRNLLEPKAFIELQNFRKIKLKSFNDRIVSISVDESIVSKYEPITPTSLRPLQRGNAVTSGSEVRGRVISIDPPNLWITILGQTSTKILPLVLNRWGLCDKRRIGIGAIVNVKNFHYQKDVIGCCPATTSLVIEQLPPIAKGVVAIHTLCVSGRPDRCFVHNVDCSSECQVANVELQKFGINSLCACDCFITCGKVDEQFLKDLSQLSQVKFQEGDDENAPVIDDRYLRKLRDGMRKAVLEAETCLALFRINHIWHQQAPPFFNVRMEEPVQVQSMGTPPPEVAEQLMALTKPLYLSLFPPNRPLHAFSLYSIFDTISGRSLAILAPRDVILEQGRFYAVTRLLVLCTNPDDRLHAMVLSSDDVSICESLDLSSSRVIVTSPSKTKLGRRRFLEQRLREL